MGANLSDDEEKCEEVNPLSCKDVIDYIEKLRIYFIRIQVKKTFRKVNLIHNALTNAQKQSARQTTINNIFNSNLNKHN